MRAIPSPMSEVASSPEKSPDDPGFFPEDLSHRPRPLIFLVGLDKTGKDVHKRIFEAFTVHRSTKRPHLNYQSVPAAHVYPPRPKQRLNYEGYTPEGIIPVGWVNKHLHKLPAAVVLFHELDWDSEEYEQKQAECVSRISCLRQSLQGHPTRILLVLIQSHAHSTSHPSHPTDQLALKRQMSLMQACCLQSDQLFPLPPTERMMDCIIKIEHSFSEQAIHYYTHRIKTVRAHKDLLSRPLHLSLFVRHQFKLGLFCEFKKDNTAALKHYNASYNHLIEVPIEERNAMEVKMVAGILNYKICQLMFVSTPRQAISTFKKHIDIFRKQEGAGDLSFQHHHWLAAENGHFARMFSEAIEGLQTLNPGMYYIIAADHTRSRREIAKALPSHPETYHSLQSPAPRFYGQYPWRRGVAETEDTDPERRRAGLSHLHQGEQRVEHNWEVIGLLCRAVNQFKKYPSRRLTASVKVRLAEEYFAAGDFKKILDLLLGTVALLYRAEHWWPLLDRVGALCLTCSYIEKSYPFFVLLLLESISHYSCSSPETKLQLHLSLERILRQLPPPPPDRCPSHLRESLQEEWTSMCEKTTHVKLDMNQLAGCIECKVFFQRECFPADGVLYLQLHMFSSSPAPLPLRSVHIHLSREGYSKFCHLSLSEEGGSFLLQPYAIFSHTFSFLPHTHDVTGSIHADSIHVDIGYSEEEEDNITLTWSLPPLSWGSPSTRVPADFSKQWGQIGNRCSTDIILRESLIGLYIQTPSPSLVNDVHRVSLILENTEVSDISNISFKLELLRSSEDIPDVTSLVLDPSSLDRLGSLTDFTCKLDSIPAGQTYSKDVFVTSRAASIQEFHLLVSYEVTCDKGEHGPLLCSCVKESRSSINIVNPLKIHSSLTSPRYLPLESVRTEDAFLLHIETTSTCPWSVLIVDSVFKSSNCLEFSQRNPSHIGGCVVEHEESLSETFCLQVPNGQVDSNFSLGDYVIKWRRASADSEHEFTETTTVFPLPRAHVRDVPYKIKTEVPAFGILYEPLELSYSIFNKTLYVQEFEAGVEDSPDFVFSGKKTHFFNILPRTEYVIAYCLCPTSSGRALLPKFSLRYLREPAPYEGVCNSMIPSHLYVRPGCPRM